MTAQTARSDLSFQLPSLSYVDAKWEEPELRQTATAPKSSGLTAWFLARLETLNTWYRKNAAAIELASMSDRELQDIGLGRADLHRVFDDRLNSDLKQRSTRI
jgi:uncharacterized protein YjiS (DUF1127 family)